MLTRLKEVLPEDEVQRRWYRLKDNPYRVLIDAIVELKVENEELRESLLNTTSKS